MLCVWWDLEGVIYELLKPGETVNAHRYHQQLICVKLHRVMHEKRPHYRKRHDKLIFLHDNASLHTSTMVQSYLETLKSREMLPHLLTRSGTFWLSPVFVDGPRACWAAFRFYEDVRKWLDEWFASKDEEFFWRGIHKLPERWEKCIVSEGKYFE